MHHRTSAIGALAVLAMTAGCSSLPERVETLDQARTLIESLEQDSLTAEVAPARYENAQDALARAEQRYEDNDDLELIEHDAYVALRNAQIAEQQIAEQRAREELQDGEAERNRILLQAREQDASRARQLAEQRGNQLEQTTEQLEREQRQARQAQQRAQELEQQAGQLEQQLAELEAEQTERGLVMTLDDVLFDFDGTELNPGAAPAMDRMAQFLEENPERNIVIEGHTDAVGAAGYNRDLSQQRAAAVREALVDRGIDPQRVQTRGLGESFPVATNETTAGRQLNRRVEIIMSGQDGQFQEGAIRTASLDEQDGSSTTTR